MLNLLSLGPASQSASVAVTALGLVGAAASFSATWVEGFLECYGEQITNVLALLLIAVFVATFIIGSGGSGGAVAAGLTVLLLAALGGPAQAANSKKDCKISCSKATQWHFDNAKPEPIKDAEVLKRSYGRTPTSIFDICACKDGGFIIYHVNQCGRMNSDSIDIIEEYWWR